MTRALALAVFGSLVACGGHTVDQDPEDATFESLASDENVLDADAHPTLALDASTCSTRPFTHTCADAGVEDFLQRMLRIDCRVPSGCSNEVTVSLDGLGCPVTVVLTEQGSQAPFDDAGTCVEAALANERWSCPDASEVSTALDLGPACSN